MISAVIDLATGTIVNTIMADPSADAAPDGCQLVAVPEGVPVDSTWTWSADAGFAPTQEPPPA